MSDKKIQSDYNCHIQSENEYPETSDMELYRPYIKCHGTTGNAEVKVKLPDHYEVIDKHDGPPEVGNDCSAANEYDYTLVVEHRPGSGANPTPDTESTVYIQAAPHEIGQLLNVYVVEELPDPASRRKRGHSKSAVPTRSIGIVPKS